MSKKIVHNFKYGDKDIPLSYDFSRIEGRLKEVTEVIGLFVNYLDKTEHNFLEENKKLLIAEEIISSSFIEGYDTYLSPKYVIEGYSSRSKADEATLSGYNAYLYAFSKKEDYLTVEGLVNIWKKLVAYKTFFRKNIRISGVRVGNKFHTVHKAPNAKYVKSLLNDMFQTLSVYEKEKEDRYDLIRPILFHYIFTFIHPFLDGNGRTARLIEEVMVRDNIKVPYCLPISSIILRNKRKYYKTFNSGQCFGISHLDILSIDITDFIDYNLYLIEESILFICNELKVLLDESVIQDNLDKLFSFVDTFNEIDVKDINNVLNISELANLLMSGVLFYTDEDISKLQIGKYGIKGNRPESVLMKGC